MHSFFTHYFSIVKRLKKAEEHASRVLERRILKLELKLLSRQAERAMIRRMEGGKTTYFRNGS
jgi:hypothetical protein